MVRWSGSFKVQELCCKHQTDSHKGRQTVRHTAVCWPRLLTVVLPNLLRVDNNQRRAASVRSLAYLQIFSSALPADNRRAAIASHKRCNKCRKPSQRGRRSNAQIRSSHSILLHNHKPGHMITAELNAIVSIISENTERRFCLLFYDEASNLRLKIKLCSVF